jgi:predicted peroxiredoxin
MEPLVKRYTLTLGASLLALSLSAQAEDQIMVSISSSTPMAQGAGLVLAGQALEQKASVRILLCGEAGDIAVNSAKLPSLKPRNATPQQMLQGLIKGGAKVEVCALYLPNTGRQASDLIPGVAPAMPGEVARHLLNAEVRVLSF